ncbi:hypothetical protein SAHY_11934 [Salinisphaera hydrothermalis EPR70]
MRVSQMFRPDPVLYQHALGEAPDWVGAVAESVGATRLIEQGFRARIDDERIADSEAGVALVASDRVLHWLDDAAIDRALDAAFRVASFGVFRIATRYSAGPLVGGRNEFASVHDAEWWRQRIAAVFGHAETIENTPREYCVIVTAPVDAALAAKVADLQRCAKRRATWARRRQRLAGRLWRLVRGTVSERRLLRELAGKHVALVGNAVSLAERDYGPAIDAADVVVRCNRGILVAEYSHGSRTDWVVTGLPISRATAESRGIQRMVWVSRRAKMMRNIPAWMFASGRLHMFSKARDVHLARELGKIASTGMKAIDLLAASNCARLDIYGFDFGASHSASQPTRPMSPDHDFDAERRRALSLIEADARLHWHP